MTWLRAFSIWGRCPQSPEIYRVIRQNGWSFWGTGYARPHAIPAAESALGSHLCVALSSAQVLPGWTTSTSPCNDFSANGDYPLNFVSHPRGSLQTDVASLHTPPSLCRLSPTSSLLRGVPPLGAAFVLSPLWFMPLVASPLASAPKVPMFRIIASPELKPPICRIPLRP